MKCYHCHYEGEPFPLSPLTPYQRRELVAADLVLRRCPECGYHQSHVGDGEPLNPQEAAVAAPGEVT